MTNNMRRNLLAQKKAFDMLGIKYLSPSDKRVVSYVSDQISNIKTKAIPVRNRVVLANVFMKSLENIRIFGETSYAEALKLASAKFVPVFPDNTSFSCFVTFDVDDRTSKPILTSGKVDHFKIPQILDTNAEIHLTHELIHGLKETRYEEYILAAVLSDVIPLFYELIGTDNNISLKSDMMNIRMSLLGIEASTYKEVTANMKKSMKDKDLYKLVQSRSGQYLNSFYYALVLYNMYKSDPSLILEIVNRVLKREITTLDMLIELGIYTKDNDRVFDTELEEVKKVL